MKNKFTVFYSSHAFSSSMVMSLLGKSVRKNSCDIVEIVSISTRKVLRGCCGDRGVEFNDFDQCVNQMWINGLSFFPVGLRLKNFPIVFYEFPPQFPQNSLPSPSDNVCFPKK